MTYRSTTPQRVLEQKDRIIRKLKAEILPYKQQQQALPVLDHNFRTLLEKYKNLQHQKILSQTENKNRYENSLRSINDLKNQLQILKGQHRQQSLQYNDLNADRATLKAQIDKFNTQIQHLKKQANILVNDNQNLTNDKSKLSYFQNALNDENINFQGRNGNLNLQNNQITLKINQLKNYNNQLSADKKYLFDKIVNFQQLNNNLDNTLNQKSEHEDSLLLQIRKKDQYLKQQMQKIIQLQNKSKRLKNQSYHKTTLLKNQSDKGIEYTNQIRISQRTLKQYEDNIIQQEMQSRNVAKQNQDIHKLNQQLNSDLNSCEQHRQNLLQHNQFLNRQLDKFSDEDQFIKKIVAARRKLKPEYSLKSSGTHPN